MLDDEKLLRSRLATQTDVNQAPSCKFAAVATTATPLQPEYRDSTHGGQRMSCALEVVFSELGTAAKQTCVLRDMFVVLTAATTAVASVQRRRSFMTADQKMVACSAPRAIAST